MVTKAKPKVGSSRGTKRPKAAATANLPALPREPTKAEKRAFSAALERHQGYQEPASVKIVQQAGGAAVDCPHNDPTGYTALLSAAFGSRSVDWSNTSLNALIQATHAKGAEGPDEGKLNSALAFMSDVAPDNAVEAAIGLQMLAAHEAALDMTRRARTADMLPQMEAYGNLATKFSRTFSMHVEALAKLRRGGEQVIKYVHVHQGGQAVIGSTINQNKGGGQESAE